MGRADIDTAAEGLVRAAHVAPDIGGIAQPAERLDLMLRRVCLAREVERQLMLLETAIDIAAGEIQIAAKVMDAGKLEEQPLVRRPAFRPIQKLERSIDLVHDTHAGGQSNAQSHVLPAALCRFWKVSQQLERFAEVGNRF